MKSVLINPASQVTLLVLLLCISLFSASGPLFYRYKDAEGRPVISAQLPADVARQGYEVVDAYGRVINTVAPALTAEQIAERDRLRAEEEKAAEAARLQAQRDAQLKRQFPRAADAERARDRRLDEIDTLITFKRNAISREQARTFDLEVEAARHQKAGNPVPRAIMDAISQQERQISLIRAEITELEDGKQQLRAEYAEKIQRLQALNP